MSHSNINPSHAPEGSVSSSAGVNHGHDREGNSTGWMDYVRGSAEKYLTEPAKIAARGAVSLAKNTKDILGSNPGMFALAAAPFMVSSDAQAAEAIGAFDVRQGFKCGTQCLTLGALGAASYVRHRNRAQSMDRRNPREDENLGKNGKVKYWGAFGGGTALALAPAALAIPDIIKAGSQLIEAVAKTNKSFSDRADLVSQATLFAAGLALTGAAALSVKVQSHDWGKSLQSTKKIEDIESRLSRNDSFVETQDASGALTRVATQAPTPSEVLAGGFES